MRDAISGISKQLLISIINTVQIFLFSQCAEYINTISTHPEAAKFASPIAIFFNIEDSVSIDAAPAFIFRMGDAFPFLTAASRRMKLCARRHI